MMSSFVICCVFLSPLMFSGLASAFTDEDPRSDYSSTCTNLQQNPEFISDIGRFRNTPTEADCISFCEANAACSFYIFFGPGGTCKLFGFVDSLVSRNVELFMVDSSMFDGVDLLGGGCLSQSEIESSQDWQYVAHSIDSATCREMCVGANMHYSALLYNGLQCWCSRFVDGTLSNFLDASQGSTQCDGMADVVYVAVLDKPCKDQELLFRSDPAFNPVGPLRMDQNSRLFITSLDDLQTCADRCQNPGGKACSLYTVKPKNNKYVCQFWELFEERAGRNVYVCPKDGGSVPESTDGGSSTPQARCLFTFDCEGGLAGDLCCNRGFCVQEASATCPADTTPAATTPAATTPAATPPADTTPAATPPADTTPAATPPADTTPANTDGPITEAVSPGK